MNGAQPQHVVLCEGYDDRAFIAGILEHLGCQSLRDGDGEGPATDAWGDRLEKGRFGFRRRDGSYVRLQAVVGIEKLIRSGKTFMQGTVARPLASLTLVRDDDGQAGDPPADMKSWVQALVDEPVVPIAGETCSFSARGVPVYVVPWRVTTTTSAVGIPTQQTLERVVCAALAEVDGARADCVEHWLRSSPTAASLGPKSYSGSYIAKWHAEDRLDAFYGRLMTDAMAGEREALQALLADVWYVFERLAA